MYGDYYKGGHGSNFWTVTRRTLSYDVGFLAAVDCGFCVVPEMKHDVGRGCLVFEDEMMRAFAVWDHGVPTYAIKNLTQLRELTRALETGLRRARDEYGFKRIYSILPTFWYRTAYLRAVENMKMWDMCVAFDTALVGFSMMLCSRANLLLDFPVGLCRGPWSCIPSKAGMMALHTLKWKKAKERGDLTTADHNWYQKMCPYFRYLDWAPQPTLDPALVASVCHDVRSTKPDWNSFYEDDEEIV